MIKRFIALVLTLAMCLSFTVGFASGSEDEAKHDEIYSVDFENSEFDSLSDYGLNVIGSGWNYASGDSGYCLEYPHTNTAGLYIGKWFNSPFTEGRYKISYDLMCTGISAYKPIHLLSSSSNGFNASSANYMPLKFQESGKINFYREATSAYNYDLAQSYTTNTWYKVELWIDLDNREQAVYINNDRIMTMALPDSIENLQGFIVQVSPSGDTTVSTYIDNISIVKEKADYSEGFNPVFADYTVHEDVIGNNFFLDKKPQFELSFKNRLPEVKSYNVVYEVKTKNGESVWKSEAETLNLSSDGEEYKVLTPEIDRFGVLKLEITFSGNETESFKKVIPFTYSNRNTNSPLNYKMGTAVHINRGRGTAEEIIPLVSDAGIGVLRGEDFSWGSFEQTPGVYKLTPYMENIVSLLKEHDVEYMNILYGTHDAYIGDDKSNPDDIMYEKLALAVTELLNQTDGTITYLENWNEYHSASMSHELDGDPEISAKLHKAIYQGAQASVNKPTVLAFAEDDWGLYPGGDGLSIMGLMYKTLRFMGGEKCFDAIGYHPYPTPDSNYFEKDKYHTKDAQSIKTILQLTGYDKNIPMIFSELGWNDYILGYDADKKADYIVRANAHSIVNNLAEVVCNYNFTDYDELSSETQRTYGMVESYHSGSEEVPYLGKESFVAVSYYNSVAGTANESEVISTGINNSYCYKFTDGNGNQTLMLGLYEGEPQSVAVKVKSKTVIVADIYGNEKTVNTINGVLNVELKPEVQYIKGDFEDEVITTVNTSQKPYAIVKGKANANEDLFLGVFKPGKDETLIESSEIEDVVYYYAQTKADDEGNFSFALPSDLKIDTKVSAKVTGKETNKQYYIYSHENALVVYNIEDRADGKKEVYQVATLLSDKYTDCENAVVIGALYNNEVLKDCSFSGASIKNANIMVLETKITADIGDEVRGFFWNNTENIIPIGKSIVLY